MELYLSKESNLECRVRELINQVTQSKYISPIDVKYEDAAPISFGYQGSEEGFLKFLEKEFRKRKLQNINYTTGVLINGDSNLHFPIIEL